MSKRTRLSVEFLGDRCLPSFTPAASFPVGTNPQAVVTADFNNDGQLDLATSNYDETTGGGTVSVLLGNGDGSFQPAQTAATGTYPISLAAGDFNADGKLDLATANWDDGGVGEYGNNAVNILLGRGNGTFVGPVVLGISQAWAYPRSIATGDLNADGKSDLVVTTDDDFLGGHVEVLLGHGDGTFAAGAAYGPYYGQLLSSSLADFNGDGNFDAAVSDWHTSSVKVFRGNGDGTLQEPSDFATDWGSSSVAAGDFNADGKIDLAVANLSSSSNSVSMLLGNGDGTFQTARSFAAGNAPQSATASDVNGDGRLDLVVTNPPDGAVSVLLGNGDGSLARPIATATGGSSVSSLVMADFNGDGRPDAAAANAGSDRVSVLLNDGNWPSPDMPSLRISHATVIEGNTGTASATFTLTLSSASAVDVTVHYQTADLSAAAGSDYQATSGTLTFAPGETRKALTVRVNGDRSGEPNETFVVNLSSPTNAVIADGQGVGTIRDDEPHISISDVTQKEGNGKKTTFFTFTVTLSTAYDQPVTVSYRTSDGTATTGDGDYVGKTGTLTFAPGETTKTITIEVKGDSKKEACETFYLDLFGTSGNSLLIDGRGVGTILNDD